MLKRFEVENYRNFNGKMSIYLDRIGKYQFNDDCLTNHLISKAIIFGRNATGKTNLGYAIKDIRNIIVPLPLINDDFIINADADEECANFTYTFQFGEDELIYKYQRLSSHKLKNESLSINEKQVFFVDFLNVEQSCFDLSLLEIDNEVKNNYLDILKYNTETTEDVEITLPFLRWIISNLALKMDSPISQMHHFIRGIHMLSGMESISVQRFHSNFNEYLDNEDELRKFERFLNVMGVECKLDLKRLPDGQKELYFVHKKPVPFYKTASSGTITLMSLYRRLLTNNKQPTFLYLDEFDAFYHYEMAEKLMQFIRLEFSKTQVVFTSHNTNLLTNKTMRPDCLFILSRDGRLTALCDATQRELREGHNLEKMYISGEFEKYE